MRGCCKSSIYKDVGNKAGQDLHFKERFFFFCNGAGSRRACLPACCQGGETKLFELWSLGAHNYQLHVQGMVKGKLYNPTLIAPC